MNKSESQIMKEIEIAVSAEGHKIFRVNVGEGFLYRQRPTPVTLEMENARSRWFSSGVPRGYSDLSGVAYPSGKAIFIECKTPKGEPSEEQCIFLLAMLAAGANAGIAHSAEEALEICTMTEKQHEAMGGYIREWLERIRERRKRPVGGKRHAALERAPEKRG